MKGLKKVLDSLSESLENYREAEDGFQKNLFASEVYATLKTLERLELVPESAVAEAMEQLPEMTTKQKTKQVFNKLKSSISG